MEFRIIQHKLSISAPATEVYNAFMDEGKHAVFTGMAAEIEKREGGKFVTCDGRNFGYSLKLEPDRRIIQAWSHESFPDGVYSIIDIKLFDDGMETLLMFRQTGAPALCLEWLDEGWKETYWQPLKEYLEKQQ